MPPVYSLIDMKIDMKPFAVLWALVLGASLSCASAPVQADDVVTFDAVRGVLKKRCNNCHGLSQPRGDLDLTSLASLQAGSVSGPVVVAGKPEESLLYTLAAHLDAPKMPPNSPRIPQRELDVIRRWIEGGLLEKASAAVSPSAVAMPAAMPAAGVAPSASTGPEPIRPLERPTAVTALAVSPRDAWVAVSGQQQVVIFDLTTRRPVCALPFPAGDVHCLKFSADGGTLLAAGGVGAAAGMAVAYEVGTWNKLFEAGDETDLVLAADLSPDGRRLALGGPGRTVNVYDLAAGERTLVLRRHTDWILSLAFSPDGLLIASGDRFGGLQVFEAESGAEFYTLRGHTGPINAVQWLNGSELLMTASEDGTVRHWNMHTGAAIDRLDAGVTGILTAVSTPSGGALVGGRSGQLAMLDDTGQALARGSMPSQVQELGISADGSTIVAADVSGQIALFSSATGDQIGTLEIPVQETQTAMTVIRPLARVRPVPQLDEVQSAAGDPLASELHDLVLELQRAKTSLAEFRDAAARCEELIQRLEQRVQQIEPAR